MLAAGVSGVWEKQGGVEVRAARIPRLQFSTELGTKVNVGAVWQGSGRDSEQRKVPVRAHGHRSHPIRL